jgi:hypothetical protein
MGEAPSAGLLIPLKALVLSALQGAGFLCSGHLTPSPALDPFLTASDRKSNSTRASGPVGLLGDVIKSSGSFCPPLRGSPA